MPKYAANPEPVQRIKTLPDLVAYLRDELGWPIAPDTVADDLTFDWSADELRLAGGQAARLQGGAVRQLRPFVPGRRPALGHFPRRVRRYAGVPHLPAPNSARPRPQPPARPQPPVLAAGKPPLHLRHRRLRALHFRPFQRRPGPPRQTGHLRLAQGQRLPAHPHRAQSAVPRLAQG